MKSVPIIGWARPKGYETNTYHGVVDQGASVITACLGRWSSGETDGAMLEGRDRDIDSEGKQLNKCIACRSAAGIQRTAEGLAETVAATNGVCQ